MLRWKPFVFFMFAALIANGTSYAACGGGARTEEQSKTNAPAPPEQSAGDFQSGAEMEIKILREGAYASLADPFLLVVRDRETYLAARRDIKELPEVDEAFFRDHILVAAFLGSRNTGGYGVRIAMENGVVKVRAKTPPADAMTTQAFTYPFSIASIKVSNEQTPEIEYDQSWKMRPYRVASGEIKISGGIAGRERSFKLEGEIGVMRHEALATLSFNLKKDGSAVVRRAVATGVVSQTGSFTLSAVSASGLVEGPHGPLVITGKFAGDEEQLTLSLKTEPSKIPDSFNGQGTINAVSTGPALPKSKRGEVVF